MKNKPISNGLKYYAICDPEGGFVYATMLHSKMPLPFEKIWSRVTAVVVDLLRGSRVDGAYCFLDQGYCVRQFTYCLQLFQHQPTCPLIPNYRFLPTATTPALRWPMVC